MPRVQEKGQVTLQSRFREALGIEAGDEVEERLVQPGDIVEAAGILVTPHRAGFDRFRGLLGKGSTDELVRAMRDA